MARYIDADALMEKCFAKLGDGQVLYRISPQEIYDAPTADVVPKLYYDASVKAVDDIRKQFLELHDAYQKQQAEIERLERICHSYALQYGTVTDQQKVIDKAKAEVAREIFEEIERLLREHSDYEILCDGKSLWYYEESLGEDISELKKKYTEEKV